MAGDRSVQIMGRRLGNATVDDGVENAAAVDVYRASRAVADKYACPQCRNS